MLKLPVIFTSLLYLAACSQVPIETYADQQPKLRPEIFFQGQLSAHGVIKNRGGAVIRHFNVDIQANWADKVGTLVEDFVFDDGETQRRIWTLTPTGKSSYLGTADDVVGEGSIAFAGNTMFLDYILRIPFGEGSVDVRVDDRMYLVSPDILINESRMTKIGVEVGSILLVIIRHRATSPENKSEAL